MKARRLMWTVALLLLLGTAVAAGRAGFFVAQTTEVPGRVVAVASGAASGRPVATVEYTRPDGRPGRLDTVTRDVGLQIGDAVPVRVRPEAPDQAEVATFARVWGLTLALAAMGLVMFGVGWLFGAAARRR